MKKVRKIIFLFVLLLISGLIVQPVLAQFADINKDSITYMYSQYVIDGYPDGTFKPLNNINRAELIKLLMSGANLSVDASLNNCFKDVSGEAWYVSWVCTAKQKGWVGGYVDGNFKPENVVNKAEAAKIIYGVLGLKPSEEVLYRFSDVGDKTWFFPYVNALSSNYYVNWDKSFSPAAPINREAVAEIVFRDILAKKLYAPLEAQGAFNLPQPTPVKISEVESLALTARDFFRVIKLAEALTYDQVVAAQDKVLAEYEQEKKDVAAYNQYLKELLGDSAPVHDAEQWNYKVMQEDWKFTYGVLHVWDPDREMPMVGRYGTNTWAVLKFDTASKKLLAYDFFTRWVDRPSLVPNIVSVKDDSVEIALGTAGPDPALMYKDGDRVTFDLRDFR